MNKDSNEIQGTEEESKEFKSLITYLRFGGIAGIVFGLVHVWSIISQGFATIRLGDALINTISGVLFLVSSWLLSKKNLAAMWVVASSIVVSLLYGFFIGRGLNYIYLIFGAIMILWFIKLKNNGEIS